VAPVLTIFAGQRLMEGRENQQQFRLVELFRATIWSALCNVQQRRR
jgi:hypothetical protein